MISRRGNRKNSKANDVPESHYFAQPVEESKNIYGRMKSRLETDGDKVLHQRSTVYGVGFIDKSFGPKMTS